MEGSRNPRDLRPLRAPQRHSWSALCDLRKRRVVYGVSRFQRNCGVTRKPLLYPRARASPQIQLSNQRFDIFIYFRVIGPFSFSLKKKKKKKVVGDVRCNQMCSLIEIFLLRLSTACFPLKFSGTSRTAHIFNERTRTV